MVLSKGPNYAISPKINTIDIAAPVESALQLSSATDQLKEVTRIKICEAIRKAKNLPSNFSSGEREALRTLCRDDSIKILQADKGNATVIMNAVDYMLKVNDLIGGRESYKVLTKDPTAKTERKLLSLLRSLRKEGKISEPFYNNIRPSEGSSRPALFYGQIKLHKDSKPLRPVVSTCGTSTYALARRLSSILRPLVGSSTSILRNRDIWLKSSLK